MASLHFILYSERIYIARCFHLAQFGFVSPRSVLTEAEIRISSISTKKNLYCRAWIYSHGQPAITNLDASASYLVFGAKIKEAAQTGVIAENSI